MHALARPQEPYLPRLRLVDLTADKVIERLAALPTARAGTAPAPLTAVVIVAGIEVASTAVTAEGSLRKAWRDRKGGGPTPLLLLADDPARTGSILAIGVADANGPVRAVESSALTEVMERLSSRPRLEAIRELSAELERLDQKGIPGLKLRDLLTKHTLDVRLRKDTSRWKKASDATKDIDRVSDWRAALTKLGYEIERRKHRGYIARFQGRPVAVVHPKADPSEFSRLDQEARPPEGVLINDCLEEGAAFGILASGGRLRLFEADPATGAAVAQYLELDAGVLQADDRPFLGLLGPEYLAKDGFEKLRSESRQFGSELRRRLDETLRQSVLPALGRSFGRWAKGQDRDLTNDSVREDLEHAALTFVFRALFLLYAESANHLPMENRAYEQSSLNSLVEEAGQTLDRLSPRSTSLWDRFNLLVKAMRVGNPGWAVPAYNGALFAADGFAGALTLERAEISDPDFALILLGLGRDPTTDAGVDYSTLEIGHLGHIYEGLLSLRLSMAPQALKYEAKRDTYLPVEDEGSAEFKAGDLLWLTHEGGRKSGGVYYTRSELVRHLVRQAVVPAYQRHLDDIKKLAAGDPAEAAAKLFDFAVLDPACGSAHFLVSVVNELADMTTKFLASTPLPRIGALLERLRTGASQGVVIDDVSLIRRLVMKRCVFGVDVSPMGAEVAKISLWLASFVPGLSLAYLDRNVIVGNSLIGVARPESLRPPGAKQQAWFLEEALATGLKQAAEAVLGVAESDDLTPDEIETSKDADAQAQRATASLEKLFNLWTAEPLGLKGARQEVELHGPAILEGRTNGLTAEADKVAANNKFLHWPLVFPGVFSRERPGFDAVVGNPPWEEVTIEELAFFAMFAPGIRALADQAREKAIRELLDRRAELSQRHTLAVDLAQKQRIYYTSSGEYASLPGDPDLYKYFCQRYGLLLRQEGMLGVVLPRSAFAALGSEGFRDWLIVQNKCRRIDFLLNSGRWAFDSEPRYTVALVAAERASPSPDHRVNVAGTATSLEGWEKQVSLNPIALSPEAFGPGWTVPLLRNQEEADLLAKLRQGSPFPFGSPGKWKCFPVAELHETNDKGLWEGTTAGWPLWKGESFDQYDPHGVGARWCPSTGEVRRKAEKPRPGAGSLLADHVSLAARRKAVIEEIGKARVAFRDVTRATDSRTVRACIVPPETFLTNKAPYLAFVEGGDLGRAACIGAMNSLPFDWQARRFVEINLNFFILEGLVVPLFSDEDFRVIAQSAARLSCLDDRFAEFAESVGVEVGPRDDAEKTRLRVEIDARVAHAWNLSIEELGLLLSDFTMDTVPPEYREKLISRLSELRK